MGNGLRKSILPAFLNLGTAYPLHFWTSPVLSAFVEDAQGRFTGNSCPGISPDCAEHCAKDLSPLSAACLLCCTYSCANTPVIPFDLIGTVSRAKECLRLSQWRIRHHIGGGLAAAGLPWAPLTCCFCLPALLRALGKSWGPTHPVSSCLQAPWFANKEISDLYKSQVYLEHACS